MPVVFLPLDNAGNSSHPFEGFSRRLSREPNEQLFIFLKQFAEPIPATQASTSTIYLFVDCLLVRKGSGDGLR